MWLAPIAGHAVNSTLLQKLGDIGCFIARIHSDAPSIKTESFPNSLQTIRIRSSIVDIARRYMAIHNQIISSIHSAWPDCAITLSIGERSFESYRRFALAGADRYLLRHETFDEAHYRKLHPPRMSAAHRKQCLWDLKRLGYQVGTGFMVGSPYQTPENLADDMLFLKEFNPQMVGIGPFIPHHGTPFAGKPAGTLELTLFLLGLIRLMLPRVLLPSTTALGTIAPDGREQGILAGANVIMPNLSPPDVRESYALYDNKLCTGAEAAEARKGTERE